jgi:hypothetical protein
MPLFTCPDCQTSVSEAAMSCPKCGRVFRVPPPQPEGFGHRCLKVGCIIVLVIIGLNVVGVIVFFIIGAIATSTAPSNTRTSPSNTNAATTDKPQTRTELADSYQHAVSDLCVNLGPRSFNFEQNDLVGACVGFAGHTLETSYPVRDRVTAWVAAHHTELQAQKVARVCVKSPYPDIDKKKSCLAVR